MKELALALALLVGPSGCASIFHGTHQDVDVDSDSPRAVLHADGMLIARGPVSLERGEDHTITAEERGLEPVSARVRSEMSWGYLALDCVVAVFTFPFGLAAPIVDAVDGALWNLEPRHVHLPAPHEETPVRGSSHGE